MRVLLVDHDSEGLENVARAIRGVLELDCVTSKGDALLLLRQNTYDVLIACERCVDGSGLDLLGRTTRTSVPLKRVFAAAPERLQLLGPRLAPFKVQRTINYPIDLEELWLAIAQVTSGPNDETDGTIERVVLDERGVNSNANAPRSGVPPRVPSPVAPLAVAAPAPQAPPMVAASANTGARAAVARLAPQPAPAPPPPAAPALRTAPASRPTAPPPRPAPQMRATAPPMQNIPPMAVPAPLSAPPVPAMRSTAPSWVPEDTDDDFAAVAAQARMGVQQKHGDEAARQVKRRLMMAGGVAVAVAAALVIAIQTFYDPDREEREARAAAAAADAARYAEERKAADSLAKIEIEVETAIMANQLDAARSALDRLTTLQPNHPRRDFLDASIKRAAELAALASAAENNESRAAESRSARNTPAPTNNRATRNAERASERSSGGTTATSVARRADSSFSGRTLETTDRATRPPQTASAGPSYVSPGTSIPPGSAIVPRNAGPAPSPLDRPMQPLSASVTAPTGVPISPATTAATNTTSANTSLTSAAVIAPTVTPPVPVDVVPAKILKRVNPTPPPIAVARKLTGYVIVSFIIGTDGKVSDINIVESNPDRIYDVAVRDAVRRWQYEPRKENGVAVASKGQARIAFE